MQKTLAVVSFSPHCIKSSSLLPTFHPLGLHVTSTLHSGLRFACFIAHSTACHSPFNIMPPSPAPLDPLKDTWPRPTHHLINETLKYLSPFISSKLQIHFQLPRPDCLKELAALSLGTWKTIWEAQGSSNLGCEDLCGRLAQKVCW